MQRLNGLRSSNDDEDEVLSSIVLWLKSVDLCSIAGTVVFFHIASFKSCSGKTLLSDVCDSAASVRRLRHSKTGLDSSSRTGETSGQQTCGQFTAESQPAGGADEVLTGNHREFSTNFYVEVSFLEKKNENCTFFWRSDKENKFNADVKLFLHVR